MDLWERERALLAAVLASLLLHALFLAVWRGAKFGVAPAAPQPIEVDLAALPPPPPAAPKAAAPRPAPEAAAPQPQLPLPERQIVNPPDAGEQAPPPDYTRLLSDRDVRVTEQSVRRSAEIHPPAAERRKAPEATNDETAPPSERALAQRGKRAGEAAEQSSSRRAAENSQGAAGERLASLPKLDELLPKVGDVPVAGDRAASAGERQETASGSEGSTRRLLSGGSKPLAVHPGTWDFLPGIREGDITLLNTKAERFAPFVRRVAARVFQHLEIRLRQAARSGAGSPGHEFAVVEAVMDRQGRFLRARVVQRESTSTFGADRVLLSVTSPETFFDANPPSGAEADDGNIHFLLLIDLQIVAVPDPRTGRLAIGYEGIAGVGLDALPERVAR